MVTQPEARELFGRNFIGSTELVSIAASMGTDPDYWRTNPIPEIPYDQSHLSAYTSSHLLILGLPSLRGGVPLTIANLREQFGWNADQHAPAFYPQDWYLREPFATEQTLEPRWYLLSRSVAASTRGQNPEQMDSQAIKKLPPAVLTAYAFFANYLLSNGNILWEHDFVWCSDVDHNGDRIYTGRYRDPDQLSKDGFSVHRHLRIRQCYGVAELLT